MSFTFDSVPFLLMLVLGILAAICFAHFYAQFVDDPKIGLGIFSYLVSYISFFFFFFSFESILFLPVTFFCYVITQHVTPGSEEGKLNIHSDVKMRSPLQALTLILQGVVYFTLAVLIDQNRRGLLCSRKRVYLN